MNKIAETGAGRESAVHPVSLVLDASPLLLRSAGVKTTLILGAQPGGARGAQQTFRCSHFCASPRHRARKLVLGRGATLERLGLLFAAKVIPYPILNWLTPASDIFHASHLWCIRQTKPA